MRRESIVIQFLNLILIMVAAMVLIIVMAALIVGVGNKNGNVVNQPKSIEGYSLSRENIQLINDITDTEIDVYLSKEEKIVELNIEEYVRGVVAAEMPAEFDLEALKAQAVAARTYALAHMEQFGGTKKTAVKGADVDDTVNSQVYMSKEERMSKWDKRYAVGYWNKITDAVNQTSGLVLTYDGNLVMNPYYFAISSGKTESAAEVFAQDIPYLKSVESDGDKEAKNYQVTTKYTYSQLAKTINSKFTEANVITSKLKGQIDILERTTGGESVKTIKIGNVKIKGSQFRELLGLRSSNFKMKFNSKNVEIISYGYGHGVGMSQWGAAAMAEEGNDYIDILTHYYQGVDVETIASLK